MQRQIFLFFFLLISEVHAQVQENFRVGAPICLSGACAEWGENSLQGLQLAVDEVNASGGILGRHVELHVQDTQETVNGTKAVSAFRELSQDATIQYFVGPTWTTGGMAILPIAQKKKNILMMSPSLGVPDFNEGGDHLFTIWPHDHGTTAELAQYAVKIGYKSAAVISTHGAWESVQANAFRDEYEKQGGKILFFTEPLMEESDFRTEASKIRLLQPQLVFISHYAKMANISKDLRKAGYGGSKMAILMDDTQIQAADGALEGTLFAKYPDPSKKFQQAFLSKYKKEPGIAADTAYDALYLYKQAIEASQTFDVDIVKKQLLKLSFTGASGHIRFDAQGGVVKKPRIFQLRGKEGVGVELK